MDWIDATTKLFGIIGQDISYTLSPAIHNYIFRKINYNAIYLVFDIPENKFDIVFRGLLEVGEGYNITIPYKERVLEFLDEVDEVAKYIGAINTIHRSKGFNTDYTAVKTIVKNIINSLSKSICYVYGAGGAARAASFALGELGCTIILINRTRDRAEKLKQDLQRFGIDTAIDNECRSKSNVIVNATPVPWSIPETCLNTELIIEFVYRPIETDLVKRAKARGIKVIDGISILVRQALEAQKIWTKAELSDEEVIGYLYARKLIW